MDFLSSLNFWDYLILALVIVAVALAIYSMRSRKKKGSDFSLFSSNFLPLCLVSP